MFPRSAAPANSTRNNIHALTRAHTAYCFRVLCFWVWCQWWGIRFLCWLQRICCKDPSLWNHDRLFANTEMKSDQSCVSDAQNRLKLAMSHLIIASVWVTCGHNCVGIPPTYLLTCTRRRRISVLPGVTWSVDSGLDTAAAACVILSTQRTVSRGCLSPSVVGQRAAAGGAFNVQAECRQNNGLRYGKPAVRDVWQVGVWIVAIHPCSTCFCRTHVECGRATAEFNIGTLPRARSHASQSLDLSVCRSGNNAHSACGRL